ncbi:xanthine dehydrogenase family protein molybdopterin-binding subunit [Anianabacter salinae]|uniref:xanthine dehydrogenase family protein molybdopterin-binding subunit n=1 Tax=Anianabacter salinae TaxID=2851023 RepID=UPI00225DFDA1|nr:xanthine dehydrogenase family protein molybdopterin-binding subunit [Anianabacter salinae]MBV0911365.1 xanthine dehydrogenase family protein molybdopterin-binding subunit [Anianabacter salinae]
MDKFGKSQSVKRTEDVRFLTGGGRYVDDIAPEGALHAFVFRSTAAHGVIRTLDVSEAREADGVALVLTAADFEEAGISLHVTATIIKNRDGTSAAAPMRPFLAKDKVRFVGEAVAVVVAETLEQAKDAAELIEFDVDDLPAHVDLAFGGAPIHDDAPDNRVYDWGLGDEAAVNAAFEAAAHRVKLEIEDNRVIVNSMEARGAYAEWDGDKLHLCFNGQGVWGMKDRLMATYGLTGEQVRVTNPDVGGGFGMKGMPYPEYYFLPEAARRTGRPVRWMSDRTEAMLTDNAGRDLVSTTELAFDEDYRITAYRVDSVSNLGAYVSNFGQLIQSNLFARVLCGTYDIQTSYLHVEGLFTNTTPVDAYRGAGRPEAIYVLERSMENAGRVLGIDPWELRRRNFIAPEKFPYKAATGETYDVGEFNRVLSACEIHADRAGFEARRAQSAKAGKLRGMGLCYYIESILGDPSENVEVAFNDDGTASIYVGTQSNGQGHETVFAKFLSDQTGIPADKIEVVQGDSDRIAWGGGTGGSRSVTVQNNVTLQAVGTMISAYSEFLAGEMGVDPAAVSFDDERFRAEGSNLTPTFLDAAEMARSAGRTDLLSFKESAKLPARSYPNGAHIAEVEIDPDTGTVEVVGYTVTDDFGNLINPMLAEGQVHGGVAQGVGQALMEHTVYDADGQLLTATFMDYGMPRADDLPMIAFYTEAVPSTANPMGMKGCGEAGTVGAMAAVANAVLDAVWDEGIHKVDMPFTPLRVWSMLNERSIAAE